MNLYLDINSRTAVTGIGVASPLPPITFKDQDTPALNIYFCLEGVVQDEGSGAALKFGLNLPPPAAISLLVYDTVFTKQTDVNGNVYYQGFPVFYTSQLVAALGSNTSIQCVGEVRTQLADGEIWRSMDINFTIWRTILLETTTPPPIVVNTYPDASTLELITRKGQPNGYAELDATSHLLLSRIPTGVELTANRDIAGGYPSLDTNALLDADEVPIDGTTLQIDATTGKITALGPSQAVVATTTEAFTVPAVAANVKIGVPTASLIINAFYLIKNAGYYQFLNSVDPGHGTFQNTGSVNNAVPATVVPFGQVLQMTGPPGPPGGGGTGGGVASLTDAIASPGQSLIFASTGVLRRLIQGTNVTLDTTTTPGGIIIGATAGGAGVAALTDAETTTGFTLIYNSTGVLKRLIPTDSSISMVSNAQTVGIAVALVDAETTTGVTLLGPTNGQIKRLIGGTNVAFDTTTTPGGIIINSPSGAGITSLTDAETSTGATLISSSTGVLKRLIAGSNITLTPDSPTVGGVTIAATGGGGGGIIPSAGLQDFDDFVSDANGDKRFKLGWVPNYGGGATATNIITSTTGCDTTNKGNGVVGLHLTNAAYQAWLSLTTSAFAPMMFVPGLGVLDIRFRVWIPSGENGSTYSLKKFGIFVVSGSAAIHDGIYFLANFGNSNNWQCETRAGNTAQTTVSSIPITLGAWHTAQILTNAAWTSIQFYMDGTLAATNTANVPTILCAPGIGSEGFSGVPQDLLCDYCYYNYQFTR